MTLDEWVERGKWGQEGNEEGSLPKEVKATLEARVKVWQEKTRDRASSFIWGKRMVFPYVLLSLVG